MKIKQLLKNPEWVIDFKVKMEDLYIKRLGKPYTLFGIEESYRQDTCISSFPEIDDPTKDWDCYTNGTLYKNPLESSNPCTRG